ncbi:MAG: MaoC family dehydratase N-terminal domain-containing protein [Gammaproteobacteria bacterium]|nr:MaoC family dehydratase N-terminal domain-containing protein [Gammaproteobacteria bacterium]
MSWGQITDEGIAAAGTLLGVQLRRTRMQWIEQATRDAIRHFAWGVGDNNPLWLDPAYADTSPAGCLVAPPCLLYAVDSTVVAPKLPGVQWMYAGTAWTWYDHIRIGDHFTVDARLLSQETKSGRRFPKWVLQTGQIEYRNQHGALVASALGRCARTPRGDQLTAEKGADATKGHEPHRYAPAELEAIEQQVLAESRRGQEPLYWEDVTIGESIPPVVKGPLSVIDILAWYSATQGALNYGGAHADAVRYRQRHADYHINAATGAKDAAGRGHLEASTGRDVGMGGVYDIGPQRIAWAQHMLTNWIGDHGFLHKLDIAVRQPNLEGDTIWWRGNIRDKHLHEGVGTVELDVEATNQNGISSARGTAVVALPSRASGPVPLPLGTDLAQTC